MVNIIKLNIYIFNNMKMEAHTLLFLPQDCSHILQIYSQRFQSLDISVQKEQKQLNIFMQKIDSQSNRTQIK